MNAQEKESYLVAQRMKEKISGTKFQNLQNFIMKGATPEEKMAELYRINARGPGAIQHEFGNLQSFDGLRSQIKQGYPKVTETKYLGQYTLQEPHPSFKNLTEDVKQKLTSEQKNFFSKYGIIRNNESLSIIDNSKIAEIEHAIHTNKIKSLQTTTFSNASVHKGYI